MSWVVVVPVKGNPGAKTRLAALPNRAALADAFALDTVAALVAASVVRRVFVVTADAQLATLLARLGAAIVPERADAASAEDRLNRAIRQGLAAAHAEYPGEHLAIVTGDLPALSTADVEAAFALAAAHELSMVPDAAGSGTTTLLARAGTALLPRFGPNSRAGHEAAGHVPLDLPASASIRRDVDTPADLEVARQLGLGRFTAAMLASRAADRAV